MSEEHGSSGEAAGRLRSALVGLLEADRDFLAADNQCVYCGLAQNLEGHSADCVITKAEAAIRLDGEHGSGGVGMPAAGDTAPPTTTPGEAYDAGMLAMREWDRRLPPQNNPYYHDTQQWLAWRSGWNDQNVWTARRG